jgi:predicted RNA methylase
MDLKKAEKIFNTLFNEIDGMQISLKDREKLNLSDKEFVYGEIKFNTFVDLLKKTGLSSNDVFYDLGCGVGKPCFVAALVFETKKACGIELMPTLFSTAQNLLKKAKELVPNISKIEFINKNFLLTDFSDANIIFSHATCFNEKTMSEIENKFKKLKNGTKIILISKYLQDNNNFKLINEGDVLMTWGSATYRIYEKI